MTAADRPYGKFYDFYSVSLETLDQPCMWLNGVLSGVLAACVVVCKDFAVVPGFLFSCRFPVCGFTSA